MSDRFANREVCNMIIYDYKTKKPILHCDYANTNSTELTGESVFVYGGWGHPRRVGFNGEKGGTFSFETQIQSFQLYSLLTGGTISAASAGSPINIVKREVVKCSTAGQVTATKTPVAGTLNVFAQADDCGTAIAGTLSSSTFTATTAADEILPYQMIVYKAQPQANITMQNSNTGDPVTLTVTCDLMADGDNNMIDLILMDEES